MLRITRTSRDDGRVVLKLEGRLVGPWVELLDEMCQAYQREREKDAPIILDGAAVGFASEEGLDLLRDLHEQGITLSYCRSFYKSSLEMRVNLTLKRRRPKLAKKLSRLSEKREDRHEIRVAGSGQPGEQLFRR